MEELIFETSKDYYSKIRVLFAGFVFHRITDDGKYLIKPIGYKTDALVKDWIASQNYLNN